MMLISELVAHLQAIYTEHGDIGVRMDGDFFGDAEPHPISDLVVGQFVREAGLYAVVLYPHKIVASEHVEGIGHA
ncbi:MAG TPA: hypothetical protein DCZ59_08585 [Bacteroidetes bacterium]|nr:hypothetical protein [Bacteroidota bacterium]